ncbi:MAG TPA: hypothetical protein VIW07_03800 [Candidatus Udaeobacter sp.]
MRIEREQIPEFLIQALANRDAALWVGSNVDDSEKLTPELAALMGLPWKLVLSESSSASLCDMLDKHGTEQKLNRKRGFIHLVSSDPEGTELPPRALPIFLLNGRQNPHQPSDSRNLGSFSELRRRLNMLNELVAARPRVVVLVSNGSLQPINDFFTLWKENFRTLVVLLSDHEADISRIDNWLREPHSAAAVDHIRTPLVQFIPALVRQISEELPETRLLVRIRDEVGRHRDLDITECDLIERPLLQNYELIQSRDLHLMQPNEIAADDFASFFDRSSNNWKPYAAGLPWRRNDEARKKVLAALGRVATSGSAENCILSIISESGAGGTVFAKMLAFEASTEGYPTLIARPELHQPEALELSRFLHRAYVKSTDTPANEQSSQGEGFEVPWLIVFDVTHWEGRHTELRTFLKDLTNDGRPAVLLVVNSPFVPAELGRDSRIQQIAWLTHELSLPEAIRLGRHLNRFLEPLGKQKSESDWRRFWEVHRPDHITSSIAHFWIALEFWLKGQLDLGESIQGWLYNSFREAKIDDDVRVLLLEIAALSIERQPMPEGVMPLSPKHRRPYSWLLEDVRSTVPALALLREGTGTEKVWAMAHDLLGRYLITSTFFDHAMLEKLALVTATDPVQLRLLLLRRIACRPALGLKAFRALALDFATKILKLDVGGNEEFVSYWREVLSILSDMPSGVRETSRTFNHHVAISLRRVVKQREFGATLDERKDLLNRAIKHLEYAISELEKGVEGETDLNLYNSLALAYQDLADVEREGGASAERFAELRAKATEATRSALLEDPSNSYVLETTAKNLIQNGEHNPQEAAASAAEALSYVYQSVCLERSDLRQSELTRLANRALNLLRLPGGDQQVQRLVEQHNPLGTLAEAWLMLTEGIVDLSEYDLAAMPPRNISNALAVLDYSPEKSNWMLLRFRYDLVATSRPEDFETQLGILDELEGTRYRMPLQLQLEHAILLHQQGRHTEANRKFRNIRQDLKQFDAIVEVPERLFWLRSGGNGTRRICEAQVVETRSHKAMAKVRELKDEIVPFVPQEFAVQTMRPGAVFKCSINFGRMGPFLKPPQLSPARSE